MRTGCGFQVDVPHGRPADHRVGRNWTLLSLLRRLATRREHSDYDYHLLDGVSHTERPKPRLSCSSSQVGRNNSVTARRKQQDDRY